MSWFEKIPMWQKLVASVVGLFASLWLVIGWAQTAYEHFEKTEHHNKDIQKVLEVLAEEKKADRIGRNHRELARLQRDLIGENYQTEGERIFIVEEIKRLEKVLRCDQDGICE